VQSGEFLGQVKAEPMAGNIFADYAAMKTLEDVFLRRNRNCAAGVANGEPDPVAFGDNHDLDAPAGSIILARVFQ